MKDFGMMHYFLCLEVWQRVDKIFLSQGKYIVDVLWIFGMMDCKSMATMLVLNLKKIHETASILDLLDPTMHRKIIGSLMYLVHTRLDISFIVSALS